MIQNEELKGILGPQVKIHVGKNFRKEHYSNAKELKEGFAQVDEKLLANAIASDCLITNGQPLKIKIKGNTPYTFIRAGKDCIKGEPVFVKLGFYSPKNSFDHITVALNKALESFIGDISKLKSFVKK